VERLLDEAQVKRVSGSSLLDAVDDAVAVVLLTHVDYRTSRMHDLRTVARRVHERGGLLLVDLSHSTGAVPLDLHDCDVDLAVGCGYKYLNGGPGAPAFVYVARRLQTALEQPISAWMGHIRPFDFSVEYAPADDISRMLSGTPPILSMATLEAALDIWQQVDVSLVRAKSVAMSDLFIRALESELDNSPLRLASPRDAALRGSHVSFAHPEGYAVVQALIDQDMIGDFRTPDLMRFGFAPLYLTFADVWRAVNTLVHVIKDRAWDQPRYRERRAVT
jgi:kynureninase